MKKGKVLLAALMTTTLTLPAASTVVQAGNYYSNQSNAEIADITNWVASTPEQINDNMTAQNINTNNLNGVKYVVQWGDTLWGISQATGISVNKLAYDNNIENVNLIYAGQVLVLNRDGEVPADYHYNGDPHGTAYSKRNINIGQANIYVSPVVLVDKSVNVDNSVHNVYKVDKQATAEKNEQNGATEADQKAPKTTGAMSSSDDVSASGKKSASSEETLTEDEFANAVMDALQDDESLTKVNFEHYATDEDADADTDSEEDTTTESLFDDDVTLKTKVKSLTQANAEKVAHEIIDGLSDDDKDTLLDADSVQLTLTEKDGSYDYNFDVTTAADKASDADSESEVDADSESDTESSFEASSSYKDASSESESETSAVVTSDEEAEE